jgi:hypothetical protein
MQIYVTSQTESWPGDPFVKFKITSAVAYSNSSANFEMNLAGIGDRRIQFRIQAQFRQAGAAEAEGICSFALALLGVGACSPSLQRVAPLFLPLVAGRRPSLSSLPSRARSPLRLSGEARKVELRPMDDRRGRGDAMRHRPFASAAQGQERVFDGGGGGGHGPAFGGDFDQGSSLMALLGAGGVSSSQPSLPTWGVEEVTAATAINLVPQSFSMVNLPCPFFSARCTQ